MRCLIYSNTPVVNIALVNDEGVGSGTKKTSRIVRNIRVNGAYIDQNARCVTVALQRSRVIEDNEKVVALRAGRDEYRVACARHLMREAC
jgi:hypothetical protein